MQISPFYGDEESSDEGENGDGKNKAPLIPPICVPSPTPTIHHGVTCDGCLVCPIIGNRYKCQECPDYDLCSPCHAQDEAGDHAAAHIMKKVRIYPVTARELALLGIVNEDKQREEEEEELTRIASLSTGKYHCMTAQPCCDYRRRFGEVPTPRKNGDPILCAHVIGVFGRCLVPKPVAMKKDEKGNGLQQKHSKKQNGKTANDEVEMDEFEFKFQIDERTGRIEKIGMMWV